MSGDIVERAVNAVLVPPQAERFAAVAGVDLDRLVLNVTGWNKLVLLDCDRVFLFPRSATGVEWFERELAAHRALARTQLGIVPRLLGYWEDPDIYPFPFAAVTRLRGQVPAEPEALIEQLGRAIACWHELEPLALAGARPPRHHDAAAHRWLRRALDPATSVGAAAEAAGRLGRTARAAAWADRLARAAQLAPVLVHGDIHEDQLLADGGQLTGIMEPDPRNYALICTRLNVPPREMIFLDDSDVCVAGARDAGIHAVHYQDNAQAIAEIEKLLTDI